MKFIVFWEISPENREKVLAKSPETIKERKQNPEKYGRFMRLQDGTGVGFSMIGKYQGFSLAEYDNDEQMQNIVELWAPLMTFKFVPIQQTPGAQQL
jgi:hypothetical protein